MLFGSMLDIKENFFWLMITIDKVIYSFVDYVYQIFIIIGSGQIFTTSDIQDIIDKINVIIGIVMLFIVSFNLLKALSNPDNLTKGDKSTTKLVSNILIVIIMLVLTPAAFRLAYQVQNTITQNNIIGRIILGTKSTSTTTDIGNNVNLINAGRNMAIDTFSAFFSSSNSNESYSVDSCGGKDAPSSTTFEGIVTASKQNETFCYFSQLSDDAAEDNSTLEYTPIISTIAGFFLLYIMISFCIDLGVRAVKLGFYQIIAPIPILSRIVPGKKDIYDKWFKATITTFLEVFIKLSIIYFAVFLIQKVPTIFDNIMKNYQGANTSLGVKSFGKVFLILGILLFAKQAPKLIGDMFGFDGSKMGLGIKKKLSEGLPAIPSSVKGTAGAIGAGAAGLSRNAFSAYKNRDKDATGLKNGFKTAGNMVKSGIGGLAGGAKRGYTDTKSAKDLKGFREGVNKAADETQLKHEERAEAGGFFKATGQNMQESAKHVGQFFTGETASAKNKKAAQLEAVSAASKELNTILDDSNNVKAVNAFYEQLKKEKAATPIDYSKFHTVAEKTAIQNFDTAIENASKAITSNQKVLTENDTSISNSNEIIEKAKVDGKAAQIKFENLKSIPPEKRTKDQHQEFQNAMQTIANSNKTIETETNNVKVFEAKKEKIESDIMEAQELINNTENNKKTEVERINSSYESEARTARTNEMVQLERDYTNAKNVARTEAALEKLATTNDKGEPKSPDVKFAAALEKLSKSISDNQAVVAETGTANLDVTLEKVTNISKGINRSDPASITTISETLDATRKLGKATGDKAFDYKTEAAKDEKK